MLLLGGQGSTIGADSRAEAVAAQDAYRDSPYIVPERQICTIRLPVIASRFTVTSPEIVAMTLAIDTFAIYRAPGCFLLDPPVVLDAVNRGEKGAGSKDFFAFMAAAIVAGELRFFGADPLKTLVGFQVISGTCADVPDISAIRANHAVMERQFGEFVRQLGERTVCDDQDRYNWMIALSDLLQGADATYSYNPQPDHYNCCMWMEYLMIVTAAGWYEGLTVTDAGTLRPPLCHYAP